MNIPCPIPRCALEIHLALLLIVMSALVATVPEGNLTIASLDLHSVARIRWVWAATMAFAGLSQLTVILADWKRLHAPAAVIGFLVLLWLCIVLAQSNHLTVLSGVAGLAALSEGFVFLLLRGHRGNSS